MQYRSNVITALGRTGVDQVLNQIVETTNANIVEKVLSK
jgi:hypothetical protein